MTKDDKGTAAAPKPPTPKTNAELIEAITGFRREFSAWADRTDSNLQWLTEGLKARLDAADQAAQLYMNASDKKR